MPAISWPDGKFLKDENDFKAFPPNIQISREVLNRNTH
jgi:hypothetical protein